MTKRRTPQAVRTQQRKVKGSDFNPHLQISNAEFFFVDVGRVGAGSQAGHGGQVPAVPSHRLHDEHPALGPRRRLFDPVAGLRGGEGERSVRSFGFAQTDFRWRGAYGGDGVEGGVGADAEVRAGDVVGDGGGDDHHGNAHLFILLSGLDQLQASHVGLQSGAGEGEGGGELRGVGRLE